MVSMWVEGRWQLDRYLIDLIDGVTGLAELVRTAPADRMVHITYEQLVADPETTLKKVGSFLDLHEPLGTTAVSADKAFGKWNSWLGDPRATSTTDDKIQAKKSRRHHLAGTYRRRWIERYIERVGLAQFETLGYAADDLRITETVSPLVDARQSARDAVDARKQALRAILAPEPNRTMGEFDRRPLY